MKENQNDILNSRINTYMIGVGVVFFIIVLRIFFLQVVYGNYYEERAQQNRLRSNIVEAERGKIRDVNGVVLAENFISYRLLFKGRVYTDEEVDFISKTTGYEKDYIIKKIKNEPFLGYEQEIIVINDLDSDIAHKLAEKTLDNPKLNVKSYYKRYYPEDKIASHVIGYVKFITEKEWQDTYKQDPDYRKTDVVGKRGVEQQYDKQLRGITGEEMIEVDALGNMKSVLDKINAETGDDLYLSVDARLQKYMMEVFGRRRGAFIAIDIKTGKIVAMISNPEYSLNLLASRFSEEEWKKILDNQYKPLRNRTVGSAFPPGSIFKVVTGMAFLENGLDPTATYTSTGRYSINSVTWRDWQRKALGVVDFYRAIRESVNTYFYYYTHKLGSEIISSTAEAFGMKELTGIDIPGEVNSVIPSKKWAEEKGVDWRVGDGINMAIGQGYVLSTPIQMLMVYQAIANNGVMMKPTVVDKFVSQNGEVKTKMPEILRTLKFSQKNYDIIKRAMIGAVTSRSGTARALDMARVSVAAKTGSAQNTGYKDSHAWTAGFFPASNPKIAFISFVEGGGSGGAVAAVIAREFVNKYYDLEDIPTEYESDFNKNITENNISTGSSSNKKRKRSSEREILEEFNREADSPTNQIEEEDSVDKILQEENLKDSNNEKKPEQTKPQTNQSAPPKDTNTTTEPNNSNVQ